MTARKRKRIVISRQTIDSLPDEVYREVMLQGFKAMEQTVTRYRVTVATKVTHHHFKTMKEMEAFIKATRKHHPKAVITWREIPKEK